MMFVQSARLEDSQGEKKGQNIDVFWVNFFCGNAVIVFIIETPWSAEPPIINQSIE